MGEIETLTDGNRSYLELSEGGMQALRIIDAQTARLAELEAELGTAEELLGRWLADVRGDYRYEDETRAFIMRKP